MLTNKIKIIILISKYIPKTEEICYMKCDENASSKYIIVKWEIFLRVKE